MRPPRFGTRSLTTALALTFGINANAQTPPTKTARAPVVKADSPSPDQVVLGAIRANPVTAPYPISATWQKNKVILAGRVGTKQVHDVAVRTAIAVGYPFRDDLVIDTGLAHAVAQSAAMTVAAGAGGNPGSLLGASPYVYPPPLFGRLDDPFFGYVPPLVSFPPWWSRGTQAGMGNQAGRSAALTTPSGAAAGNMGAAGSGFRPLEVEPAIGQVDVSVDIAGQVFLRGSVVSDQARREIEDSVRAVPGVSNVFNDIQVMPRRDPAADSPPPPPIPMADLDGPAPAILPARPRALGAAPASAAIDSEALSRRVIASIGRQAPITSAPVKVRSADGVVTISGQVPTAFEAMLVYRATQQTPGVREIIDHLEFTVPDDDHPNPLLEKGRPEDIEPYLASQIRRHLGDIAHVDRVATHGNVLEVRGTIQNRGDLDRLLAILRSISVLHGYKIEAKFNPA
jgi:osmotically-inducible protein OsmY